MRKDVRTRDFKVSSVRHANDQPCAGKANGSMAADIRRTPTLAICDSGNRPSMHRLCGLRRTLHCSFNVGTVAASKSAPLTIYRFFLDRRASAENSFSAFQEHVLQEGEGLVAELLYEDIGGNQRTATYALKDKC